MCDDIKDMKGIYYNGMPKTKNVTSLVENSVIKTLNLYDETIKNITNEINKRIEDKLYLDRFILRLSDEEQELLKIRYIEECGWDYIPMKIHISRKQCFRIHDKILEKMKDMLSQDYN